MAKQFNPMPPSAKSARRLMWVQAVLAILAAAGLYWAHQSGRDWVPAVAADNVYRAGAGLAVGAVVLLLLTLLMRYQWRWLWVLLLGVQAASLGGLIWLGVKDINWFVVVILLLLPIAVLFALLGRVTRRWFHH